MLKAKSHTSYSIPVSRASAGSRLGAGVGFGARALPGSLFLEVGAEALRNAKREIFYKH